MLIICRSGQETVSVDQVADGKQIIFNGTRDLLETRSRMDVSENKGSDTLAVLSICRTLSLPVLLTTPSAKI